MGFRDIVTARICSVCHFTTRVYGILSILSGISHYIKRKRIQSEVLRWPSGGFRGGSGGSNEPHLEPKLFHFHGEFQEKLVKLHKSPPPLS